MKTLKFLLPAILLLAAFTNSKAQCILSAWSDERVPDTQFSAYVDSSNLPGTYFWDFGDGDTVHQFSPVHSYATSGNYTACFHYQGTGCTQDSCVSVNIDLCDFNPQISYTNTGLDASFSASYVPAGSSYSWIFYFNGTTQTSSNATPLITYPYYGTFTVGLSVTTPQGCTDTAFAYVNLINPCNANFGYYQSGTYALDFHAYQVDSLNPSTYSYAWTFEGVDTNFTSNPTHDFGAYGSYNVCLTVFGPNCDNTICHQINVAPPPPPTYNIYGTITKGGNGACHGLVYLISDTGNHYLTLEDVFVISDSCSGVYQFYNHVAGTYYVKALLDTLDPDYADYLPTYYGNELNWADATAINLAATVYNVDISLTAGVNPGGPGFVGGLVSQGAGLTIGGHNESRSTGDPLPNIQVNILTDADVPVASTITDGNGMYSFSNLALGTYKVYVEEINKVPYPQNVTLTANNPTQSSVNVSVNSNSAVTGISEMNGITIQGVFPNPVENTATIGFSLKQNATINLKLTDITGRVLQNRQLDLTTGVNQIKLDLSSYASGIYHLLLSNDTYKTTLKLVKSK